MLRVAVPVTSQGFWPQVTHVPEFKWLKFPIGVVVTLSPPRGSCSRVTQDHPSRSLPVREAHGSTAHRLSAAPSLGSPPSPSAVLSCSLPVWLSTSLPRTLRCPPLESQCWEEHVTAHVHGCCSSDGRMVPCLIRHAASWPHLEPLRTQEFLLDLLQPRLSNGLFSHRAHGVLGGHQESGWAGGYRNPTARPLTPLTLQR